MKKERELLHEELQREQSKVKILEEELRKARNDIRSLEEERDYYQNERDHYRRQSPPSAQLDRPRSPRRSLKHILI